MAKIVHTCTGCIPIDASIIESYVALVNTNKAVAAAEDERQEAEGQGDYSDTTAYPNTRRAKEAARQAAEAERVINEGSDGPDSEGYSTSRIKMEIDRQSNEETRQSNEETRQSNEETRQSNEETRQAQEGTPGDEASASGSRWARYKYAEAARETAYDTAEAARDAAMAPIAGYYACSTAAATAAKEVAAPNYVLINGGTIKVKFTYANSATSPTLNINSTGAKAIVYNGAIASATNTWAAGAVVEFYYDPTYDSNAGAFVGIPTVVTVSQNTLTIGGVDKGEIAGQLVENAEWVKVVTDSNDKILYGVKTDGKFYFGDGCPPQVQDYVRMQISEYRVSVDALLATKVDKVTGKSLIDADFATSQSAIENPEFLEVKTDAEDQVLQGIKSDGTSYIGRDLEVGGDTTTQGNATVYGNINLSNVSVKSVDNPEYLKATTDAQGKVLNGIKKDGSHYMYNVQSESIDAVKKELSNKVSKEEGKGLSTNDYTDAEKELVAMHEIVDNPEYIKTEVDSEGKLLAGRTPDGAAFEIVGFTTPKVSIDGTTAENIDDPEGRTEIKTDAGNRILSYRDEDGVLHEIVGIDSNSAVLKTASVGELAVGNFSLSDTAKDTISNVHPNDYIEPNLPKYGTVNMTQETFYLEADNRVGSINDVVPMQDYPNTDANAILKMTPVHYYIKSTLTDNGDGTYSVNANSVKLRHFAYEKVELNDEDNKYYANEGVRKVNGICYYLDTLVPGVSTVTHLTTPSRVAVKEGYSVEAEQDASLAEGGSKMVNTEVIQLIGIPVIDAWTVENSESTSNAVDDEGKRYNHRILADFNFGHYYTKNNVPIYVKLQGQSTTTARKHGYRFTFYKNNTYAKKDKIKIGEMIRLSGYNMKAEMRTFITSSFLYRIFNDIWEHRPVTDRFDWDAKYGYFTGATGIIKDFPVQFNAGGDFYGIYFFGLKKDERNYMLDGDNDASGMFIQGNGNYGNVWGATLPYNSAQFYEDEMMDEMSQANIDALETWHHFIQNRLYKGSDNQEYNSTELTEVDSTMYVTSTLVEGQPVEGTSVSAELIEFNKENIPERCDVLGFIDYLIALQVFLMEDSFHNNLVLYSNSGKKKFWPFFYDVNSALRYQPIYNNPYNVDYFTKRSAELDDVSFWNNFMDVYWDDIVNRYHYLRHSSLSMQKITNIYKSVMDGITSEEIAKENSKWGSSYYKDYFETTLQYIEKRLNWLDTEYYK